jgi:ABC-type nitrate/sulfonate/bicarbonate transport system substrate-binding protein
MGKNKFRLLAGALGAALLLSACGSGGASGSGSGAKSVSKLTATSGGACICHAPLYVGISKGFFKKRGLDVQFRQISSGFTAMGALSTGDADVADAVVAVAAQASSQGIDSTGVVVANGDATGTVDTSKYFAVVARKGTGITEGDVASLRGKTIGVPTGTIAHQYLYYTLQKAGLNPTADVKLQNVAPANLVSALQSKSVDAIVSWEPIPLTALKGSSDAFTVVRGGGAIQYLFFRWMSPKFLSAQPERAKAFIEAYLESMQFARQHTDETATIVGTYLKGVDKNVIVESLKYLNFDPRVSKVTMKNAQQGLEFARAAGTLKTDYPVDSHLAGDLLASVEKAHPEYLKDLPAIPGDEALTK